MTRQNLPVFDKRKVNAHEGLLKGAYIISKEKADKLDSILIATGSEVHLALEAQDKLEEKNIHARVVSMPCWELFRSQPKRYKEEVLPSKVKNRIAVEAAASFGWCEWVGNEGKVIGIDRFGASAPYKDNFEHFGFSIQNIIKEAQEMIERKS